jgi:hypothetical protein
LKILILSQRGVTLALLRFKALVNRLGFGLDWRDNLSYGLFLHLRIYKVVLKDGIGVIIRYTYLIEAFVQIQPELQLQLQGKRRLSLENQY